MSLLSDLALASTTASSLAALTLTVLKIIDHRGPAARRRRVTRDARRTTR